MPDARNLPRRGANTTPPPHPIQQRPRTLGGRRASAQAPGAPRSTRSQGKERSPRIAIHWFGEHRFDPTSGRLERAGLSIALRPQVVALLADLIARRSRRVTRSELARRVWAGRAVTASSFSTLVAELRRALGDDGRRQAVIRTLGRDAYRFVAAVRVEGAASSGPEMTRLEAVPIAECVHESAGTQFDAMAASAHDVADRSIEAALADGPRHLEVTGAHCDAFVDDWACTARDRGFAVHRGHGVDEQAPPLWPWWQVAASILEAVDSGEDARELAPQRPKESLRALWHRVRVEMTEVARRGGAESTAGDRQRRFALCHDLSRALLRSTGGSPCAITLEAPRGLDLDSRRLLRFLLLHMDRRALWIVTSSAAPESPGTEDPNRAWPRTDRIRFPAPRRSASRGQGGACGSEGPPPDGSCACREARRLDTRRITGR